MNRWHLNRSHFRQQATFSTNDLGVIEKHCITIAAIGNASLLACPQCQGIVICY
jgi:hypothetical protein